MRSSGPARERSAQAAGVGRDIIIAGRGIMHIDGETGEVTSGQAIYIPPRSVQWIESVGGTDLELLAVVDPAWREGDEEVIGAKI